MARLLTIGLPFYNAQTTLNDAVQSIMAQTSTEWELILVNDGSVDDSAAIARELAADDRITLIDHSTNRGLPHRLNEITGLARGDLLVRMDADDMMHPERLERQAAFLANHPTVDLVGTAMYVLDDDDRLVGLSRVRRADRARDRLRFAVVNHPTVMGRTSWFEHHPYDERFRRAQDFELWTRTDAELTLRNLDEPLHFHRQDLGALAGRGRRTNTEMQVAVLRAHGVERVGKAMTALLIARVHIKAVVYAVLNKVGIIRIANLVRLRRIRAIDVRRAEAALDVIRGGSPSSLDREVGEPPPAGGGPDPTE